MQQLPLLFLRTIAFKCTLFFIFRYFLKKKEQTIGYRRQNKLKVKNTDKTKDIKTNCYLGNAHMNFWYFSIKPAQVIKLPIKMHAIMEDFCFHIEFHRL